VPRFTPYCYGVLATSASPRRDFSWGQDEIKPSVPSVEGPIQPPHSHGVWQLLQDILRPRPDPGNNAQGNPRPPASGRGERCRPVPSRLSPLASGSGPFCGVLSSSCGCSSFSVPISPSEALASRFGGQRRLCLPPAFSRADRNSLGGWLHPPLLDAGEICGCLAFLAPFSLFVPSSPGRRQMLRSPRGVCVVPSGCASPSRCSRLPLQETTDFLPVPFAQLPPFLRRCVPNNRRWRL